MLTLSFGGPAAALGEDGPFELPISTQTVSVVPGAVTTTPLEALLEDELESELELASARLAIPTGLEGADRERLQLGEDARSLTVAGEGTWSLLDTDLVFTPAEGFDGALTPVALSIDSVHGTRSLPTVLGTESIELQEIAAQGSAGVPTTVGTDVEVPGTARAVLLLDGMPAGTTLVSDGSRLTIPEQGSWEIEADGSAITHTPAGPGLGYQPDPIQFAVLDKEGATLAAGRVSLTVPIISDLYRSALYGEDIVFAVGEGQQFVDPQTLRLEPLPGSEGAQVDEDGTEVVVPEQGVWTLDRETATVRFSPFSADVRITAPMSVTGGTDGLEAAPALLDTAYPVLVDRSRAEAPGSQVQFDLASGARDVLSDSLRFDVESLPEGAEVSADGTEVMVPGQGTWRIDLEARTVTMTPEDNFVGTASPVGIAAVGIHANNPVRATLEATITPVIATLRDDEVRTAPGSPVSVDVLRNDTAGAASRPLVPSSVELRSLSATNLHELEEGRGTRLVIPSEGTYVVEDNGSITFTPQDGFTGRGTPVKYLVTDSEGISFAASLTVEVDPALTAAKAGHNEASGINSLLLGLLPSSRSTSLIFGTIVLLLMFGGGVSLWIGTRMVADRRMWQD